MGNSRFTSETIAEILVTIYAFILFPASMAGFAFLLGIDFIGNHSLLTAIIDVIAGWGCIFLLYLPYPFGGLIVVTLLSALSTYGLYKVLFLYVLSDSCLLIVLSVLAFLFFFAGGICSYRYVIDNVI